MSAKQKRILWPILVTSLMFLSVLAFVAARSRRAAGSHGAMPTASSARSAALETSYPAFTLTSSRTVTNANGETRRL
jgi:hypothetical protein